VDIKSKDYPALDIIGFEGRTNSVVMIANPTTKTKDGFKFSGIAKGTIAEVYETNATLDMVAAGTVTCENGTTTINLKPKSIYILVYR